MSTIPKITVIIPVYKAEKYIYRCVRSLYEQTLDSIEYIFIDDNSPDKSIDIVKGTMAEYPDRAKQTRIVRNAKNLGVGRTRQKGLDLSTGEYIIHCDPDDWVDCNMLEDLYKQAKQYNSDVVICDIFYEYAGRTKVIAQNIDGIDNLKLITKILKGQVHGSLCNKLIKHNFIKKNNISFVDGLNFCEDMTFCLKLLMEKAKVRYFPHAFYHYDKYSNSNSLTSVNTYYAKRQYYIWISAFERIITNKQSSNYRTGMAFIAYWAFVHDLFTNEEYKNEFKNKILTLLLNRREIKVKFFTFFSALGLKNIMYKLYIRLKR